MSTLANNQDIPNTTEQLHPTRYLSYMPPFVNGIYVSCNTHHETVLQ